MADIVVFISLTLDGVMQAPGRADEDRRGGFEHGGWAAPYSSPEQGQMAADSMATTGALLLGRRTYEDFYSFWPHQTDNPFTEVLNASRKYVASRTLREPLPWQNSVLLSGDAPDEVAKLRQQPGKDIVILGSGDLVRSLMTHDLVDRYILSIHPLVLGSGQRLFTDESAQAKLRLLNSLPTSTGVVLTTYEPEDRAPRA
ncbi:MAG: dihydrofolate reductase [Actinobacteria bacterium]|nr:MAG: dihydrofolate reductase [Actinomycetota bacterium]